MGVSPSDSSVNTLPGSQGQTLLQTVSKVISFNAEALWTTDIYELHVLGSNLLSLASFSTTITENAQLHCSFINVSMQ